MTSTSVKLSTSNTTSDSIAFGVSDGSYGYIIPGADTVVLLIIIYIEEYH